MTGALIVPGVVALRQAAGRPNPDQHRECLYARGYAETAHRLGDQPTRRLGRGRHIDQGIRMPNQGDWIGDTHDRWTVYQDQVELPPEVADQIAQSLTRKYSMRIVQGTGCREILHSGCRILLEIQLVGVLVG